MASPMATNSAPSPSLTHASSADDGDLLDRYLDTSAFGDVPGSSSAGAFSVPASASQGQDNVQIADYSNTSQDPFNMDPTNWWSQYDPMMSKDNSMAIDPSSLFEDNMTVGSGSAMEPEASPSILASTPSDQLQQEDERQTSPEQEQRQPTKRAAAAANKKPTAQAAGRRTRSSASKPTNPHKSVADLALPMKEVSERPQIAHKKEEDDEHHNLPHIVFPVPDYIDRPSAEEYAKLSSKEKRQLRNKISARNFRHRRKEYITTLEEEIATRDSKIVNLEEEMSGLRVENTTLRTDLDLLKKTVDDLLNNARPANQPTPSTSNNILTPNLNKDKGMYSKSSFGPGGHNALGSLDVHTLFMPAPSPSAFVAAQSARRNMNPRLNKMLPAPAQKAHLPGNSTDDSFFGSNPYLIDSENLDKYRASLYSKLTANIHGAKADPVNFQPSYFSMPTTSSSTSSDPLKSSSAAPMSPVRSDGEMEQEVHGAAAAQTARVASLASNTLISTMFNTFVQTFVGAHPSHLADLLSGRASLHVVPDRDAPATSPGRRASIVELDDVERELAALKVDDNKITTKRS